MYIYKRTAGTYAMTLSAVKKIPALYGLYTRSFTIDGNNILLCSQGAGGIVVVNKKTFAFVGAYPVPDQLGGVVQVVHAGGSLLSDDILRQIRQYEHGRNIQEQYACGIHESYNL